MLNAELGQRPADLGQHRPGDLAASLGRPEIVAAAIGVERAEQAVARDHLAQAAKGRGRALLIDQEGRVDRAGGVIQGDHQIVLAPIARQPGVGRGVLMQHHADHRPARPLLAVRRALRRRPHQARAMQMHLGHRVAQLVAVALHQLLMEVLHRELTIVRPVKPQHPLDLGLRRPPTRGPKPTVGQASSSLVVQPVTPAPKRPVADPQHLRRRFLAKLTPLVSSQQVLEPHPSYALVDARPVHPHPQIQERQKPDTSRATNSRQITS